MFVVDDDTLYTLQGHYNHIVDLLEAASGLLSAIHHLQIELQTFGRPLTSMITTILLTVFLNGNVGEMYEHVIHLRDVRGIQLVAESAKSLIIDIGSNGSVAGDQYYLSIKVPYNLKSNFLPPMRRGLSIYREIT